MKVKGHYVQIAVELPIDTVFSYSVPEDLKGAVKLGLRALVPFGKRTVTGYIVGFTHEPGVTGVKAIIDLLDEAPLFEEKRLKFFKWLAQYYFAHLGEALSLSHPAGINISSKRFVSVTESGLTALDDGDYTPVEKTVLKGAFKRVAVSALEKRLKGVPVNAAIRHLVKKGFLKEELLLKGGGTERTEKFAALATPLTLPAPDFFKRAPLREKLWSHLKENGETALVELNKLFGGAAGALKNLTEAGLVNITVKNTLRDPLSEVEDRRSDHEPGKEQAEAITAIVRAIDKGGYNPFLLFGVTGSGKTLVYLNAIEHAVKHGKKAIFTVPEITLTPWPAAYLKQRFPGRVALWHSGLSDGERFDEWQRVQRGEADIVVGARSALFAPIKDLGLIIVDEEHETSYKQEDGIRYNGRDAALKLAQTLGITVVLGSATPSVETFYNATVSGKLASLYLKSRVEGSALPEVEVVDMRGKKNVIFSDRLKTLLSEALVAKNQALLFVNRRGFSSTIICKDCGRTFPCLNCSVTLTLHKRPAPGVLKCHYCDLSLPVPNVCPDCKGVNLAEPGIGTEKVEQEAALLFPEARVIRMDRDTVDGHTGVKEIIAAVEDREADILVGTQMASKGHHFPGITFVGVVAGDTSLNMPDFRGAERTFHLITQAGGRAGRGDRPGRVIVQTINPEHYAFKCSVLHDYESFFNEEIAIRKEVFYPPFSRLCLLRLDGLRDDSVMQAGVALKTAAERFIKGRGKGGIAVLGPAPAIVAKVKGRFRWNLLVKGDATDINGLHSFIKGIKAVFEAKKQAGVSLTIDMDPLSIV
ncbi:primosomal protein N' [bacterium]|nr:MAG: primosomal protein N' [bacterium]